MHELVAITQKNLHLQGTADLLQRAEEMKALRDPDLRKETGTEVKAKHPDRWADRDCQDFMYGVDVMKICAEQWDELSIQASKNLKTGSNDTCADSYLGGAQKPDGNVEKTEASAQVSQFRKRARSPGGVTSMINQSPRKKQLAELISRDFKKDQALVRKIKFDRGTPASINPDELLGLPLSANAPLLRNFEAGKM